MVTDTGGPSPFHESYFDHPCRIFTDLDVLDIDIRGYGISARFFRYWYNLFLLSYSCECSRVYFVSSQALRLERMRQYRHYRNRIHPMSKFSNAWSCIILIVTVLNKVIFHHNTALIFGALCPVSLSVGIIIELTLMFDIYINFKTGYTDTMTRKVILDSTKCFWQYSSTKLFLHAMSAMPLQLMLLFRYGTQKCDLCIANVFVCCLKLINITGYFRLLDSMMYLTRERDSYKKMQVLKFLRIFLVALLTMLQFLDFFDTLNILIVINTKVIHENSYFSMIVRVRMLLKEMSSLFAMSAEFSVLIKALFIFGYGMYNQDYYLDKIFSLLCESICWFFMVWCMVEMFAVLQRVKFAKDVFNRHKQRSRHWMRSQKISDKVADKVNAYFEFSPSRVQFFERRNPLYTRLPHSLIMDLKLNSYYGLIRKIPYFTEWPVHIVQEMVILLKREVHLKNNVVSHIFVQGEGMIVVAKGVLAVYNVAGIEQGHLIDGDYFGELSLVTDKEIRTSTVIAVTNVQVVSLNKVLFRNLMKTHSKLFFNLREILRQKFTKRESSFQQSEERAPI